MAKYLSQELVCKSFERLSSRNKTGKTHMERTSALMYFLSVDAAFKHFDVSILDLNPDSFDGKNNRKQVELEFTKLVLVGNSHGVVKQVTELGRIEEAGTHPEKRISSNFLTVPLKKASNQTTPFNYPSRPCPLFKMGLASTGTQWGVSFHDNWMPNFLAILTTIKGSTPSLDLAVFVCRDCGIDDVAADIFSALEEQLKKKFTKNLADFWIQRMEKEKVMYRGVDVPFSDHHAPFASIYKQPPTPVKQYEQMNKSELIARIHHLELKLATKD
ncbi:MAG: hypothetical protein KJ850_08855 [Gammaproteobacteria bacterium]|nr:hypothetical protein [Gammaproteobacteria bacterium]MBU1625146.1 hypothetical protein [Gammaproteobacteria bacterium]MBU1981406.1 hypothetical protein [Gammaproteobacteria bacterium]